MGPITGRRQISTASNYEELCTQVVQKTLLLSQRAIKEQGRFSMALSGGETPRGVYALMAGAYRDQFDWKNIYFFLGDERWVPAYSPRSNYKMIVDVLLSKIDIPASNFHGIPTDTSNVLTSASVYEKELIQYFVLKSHEFPSFDLIFLGLGQDGHTASLFPHHSALNETKHLVVAVEGQGIAEKRVSLTLPVINHARAVFFLVNGLDKAAILKDVLEGKKDVPAAKVNPVAGEVWWFVDQTAAGR